LHPIAEEYADILGAFLTGAIHADTGREGEARIGYSKSDKAETHARIVKVAAKRFRELGLEGIGVADVMKEAGVTVGGFYKHFHSRDELVVEALATAFLDLDRWEEHTETLTKALENYLSEEHRDAPGSGCALGALLVTCLGRVDPRRLYIPRDSNAPWLTRRALFLQMAPLISEPARASPLVQC
jgi:AcrR family transcriptional regulator